MLRARPRVSLVSRALVRSLFALAFVGGVGCAASHDDLSSDDTPTGAPVDTNEAIVHGAIDKGRHPAVVALVIDTGSGTALCSGALVAPDVVLTARHCVSRLKSEAVDCGSSTPATDGTLPANAIVVVTADEVKGAKAAATGAEIATTRGPSLCNEDIALVRLDRPIDGIEPLEIATDDASLDGKTVTSVGYGLTKTDAGTPGIRRFRTHVAVESSTHAEFVVAESTCQGDSGGPAIDEESGAIVGVVSRGGGTCTGKDAHNVYTRTGAFSTLIDGVLGKSHAPSGSGGSKKPPASDIGEPCTSGKTCSAGICVSSGGYCSHDCGKGKGKCEHGYKCTHKKKGDVGVCTKKA